MKIILLCFLFCVILALCFMSFALGFYLRGKIAPEPPQREELTDEELRKLKKEQKEAANFWNYSGDSQE